MRVPVLVVTLVCLAATAAAQTLSFSGSAAAEALLTPANGASPLNPRNVAGIEASTVTADLITRLEIEDEASRWKIAARGRGGLEEGEEAGARFTELYVSVSPIDSLTLSAGRIIERWGSGYAWNPSAFVAPRKNPSDPGDRRGLLSGIDMLKADALVGGTSLGAYILDGGEVAVRASRLIGATDISLYAHRENEKITPGISVSRVVGEALELHAEAATGRALVGAQYTFASQLNVVAELYHSDEGLSGAEWDSFRRDVAAARDRQGLIEVNQRFRPLQMQRDYLFLRLARPWRQRSVTTEVLAITGLRDGSSLLRASVHYALRPDMSLYLIDTEFLGDSSDEMSYIQIDRSMSFGARVYF